MRQMLLFVLLVSAFPWIDGVERQGAQPRSPKAIVTRDFGVPGHKSAPRAPSPALSVTQVIEQFARRERTALRENRERAAAEMTRLRRVGGLQALWKQQLEQLDIWMVSYRVEVE